MDAQSYAGLDMSSCGHILWRSFRARYAPVALGLLAQLTGHSHLARRLMSGAISPLPICFHGVHWDKFIFLYLAYAHNYMHFLRTYKINDLMSSYVCNDIYIYIYIYMCVCVCVYIYVCVCVYIYIYIYCL